MAPVIHVLARARFTCGDNHDPEVFRPPAARRRAGGDRLVASTAALAQAKEQFFPLLVYRTGAYAPNGTPWANGKQDYIKMVNARDGGVNGVKLDLRGMRDRLRHRPRRRVLRAPEEQAPA